MIPSGHCGRDFIKLNTEWLSQFTNKTCFEGIALKVLMLLPNLLLQKPSPKSKARDHTKALTDRLELWRAGKLDELWKEGAAIQKKIVASGNKPRSNNDIVRIFTKLMLEGKVGAALKYLEEQSENAVLKPTEEIIAKLKQLHPDSTEIQPNSLIQGPLKDDISPAYFNNIDEGQIFKAASRTKGSGGRPFKMPGNGSGYCVATNLKVRVKT